MSGAPSSTATYSRNEIEDAFLTALRELEYLQFAQILVRLLHELGYASVRLSDRKHLRGRTKSGGADASALTLTPLGPEPVLIQFKKYNSTAVSRRYIDEVRGTLDRRGVPEALILTTGRFSEAAQLAAADFPGRPVRLIDGHELAFLCIKYQIGCCAVIDLASGATRYILLDSLSRTA